MEIKKLAEAVHQNAVEHGWWDEDRSVYEIVALIHSEWSEALEEARSGRPMEYVIAHEVRGGMNSYMEDVLYEKGKSKYYDEEVEHGAKPEGIAVELIDGVIHTLDFFGQANLALIDSETGMAATMEGLWNKAAVLNSIPEDVPTLVAMLHKFTSDAIPDAEDEDVDYSSLLAAASLALTWVHNRGIDPLELLMEKHEYNKGRPYKHGKQF